MSSVWDRFDDIASAEEVETAKEQYKPLDAGRYRMALEEIKPDENKDGMPMVKGKFKLVEGGKIVFYNQNLQNLNYPNLTAANIADATIFIGGLLGQEIKFEGLAKLARDVESIPAGGIYVIEVSYGKKDTDMKYPKLKVISAEADEVAPPFDV